MERPWPVGQGRFRVARGHEALEFGSDGGRARRRAKTIIATMVEQGMAIAFFAIFLLFVAVVLAESRLPGR